MSKSTKTNRKANKTTKSNKVAKATNGKAPKLDAWGFEVGTTQAKVNKLLKHEPQTVREMAEKGEVNHRRVRYQCRVLTKLKLTKRAGDGYAWVKNSKALAAKLAKSN